MTAARPKPELTLVIPCYNEAEVLPRTIAVLRELLDRLSAADAVLGSSHLLLVDDGSGDDTWAVISEQAMGSEQVRGLRLSRNRGHQNALLAGLHAATGDVVVSIDADLQDDVEAIPMMLADYGSGADVVFGVRDDRSSDSAVKRLMAETYYRLLSQMGGGTVYNHADFRLLSRRALDALRQFNEVNLFLRGIVPLLGFPTATVKYQRQARRAGTTKYTPVRILALALDGITSFTTTPLRVVTVLGLLISLLSLLLISWVLWARLVDGTAVPGWASTVVPLALLGGFQLLALGVIGEYVAKMYLETKHRPPYFIEARTGHQGQPPVREGAPATGPGSAA